MLRHSFVLILPKWMPMGTWTAIGFRADRIFWTLVSSDWRIWDSQGHNCYQLLEIASSGKTQITIQIIVYPLLVMPSIYCSEPRTVDNTDPLHQNRPRLIECAAKLLRKTQTIKVSASYSLIETIQFRTRGSAQTSKCLSRWHSVVWSPSAPCTFFFPLKSALMKPIAPILDLNQIPSMNS